MGDKIEKLLHSTIQHGKENDRVYLMKLDPADLPNIVEKVDEFAKTNGYSKVFAKIPTPHADAFVRRGYCVEAEVPGFYQGETGASYIARYLDPERAQEKQPETVEQNIALAKSKAGQVKDTGPGQFTLRVLAEDDADQMVEVYRVVFETYPFPIHDPEYLKQTMRDNIIYFGAFDGERLAAVASAERDLQGKNAEMTDFATHPDYLGHGLAVKLLIEMEREMKRQGYPVVHTIARSLSAGMNITFAKLDYIFAGTLTNNTNISGNVESMNVWYKRLA